jgi:hypothetical protein
VTTIDSSGRSFVVSSVGGWLAILGFAVIFGPRDVYPVGAPIPMVGGLRLTILPAATIEGLHFFGRAAIALGLLAVIVAAAHRAAERRFPRTTASSTNRSRRPAARHPERLG